jgi:predicted dehydrogenase
MDDLRIGVIGLGARGGFARHFHRPGHGARIAAVCDLRPQALAGAGARLGVEPWPDPAIPGFEDPADLLGLGLDAVVVLTPDDTHAAIGEAFLDAGIAVYLEKPMATSIEGCDRLLRAAERSGSVLHVGHNMRHMPVVTQLRELILADAIGEVQTVWCRHFVGHGGDYYFKDWHAERARGTGLLLQKGAHDLDVIHWLAGAYTRQVSAFGALRVYGRVEDRRDNSDRLMQDWFSYDNWPPLAQRELNPVIDVEDLSLVNLRLGNGVLASYQQCHFSPDYWRNYTVIGTEGRLENFGDGEGGVIRLWNRRHDYAAAGDAEYPIAAGVGGHGGGDTGIVADFLHYLREGGERSATPLAAREAVAAGVAATRSLRAGGRVLEVPEYRPAA